MKVNTRNILRNVGLLRESAAKYFVAMIVCSVLLIPALGAEHARAEWPHIALSKDGVPITYEVYGDGEPTLIFVHGWSCDSRYWREQIPYFSKTHRIVILDLAGHGNSGMSRARYTMGAFGEDVRAVAEAVGTRRAVLIGHSMGGSVIAEAARLMPDRVIGLIGIDTLDNIEYPLTGEQLKTMLAPLEENFQTGSRLFVGGMILPDTDPRLRDWILSDVSSAPPPIALNAINEMLTQYVTGDAAKVFEQIRIPVITVNGDTSPIAYEANRRHMFSYDAIVMKKADHFLMMDQPKEFNLALEKAINMLLDKPAKK
jgi:pimeloyl-ACP methyl ester carboxylesterase